MCQMNFSDPVPNFSDPAPSASNPDKAAAMLADLVGKHLGVTIDAAAVKSLFHENWPRLSVLAHAIHEAR